MISVLEACKDEGGKSKVLKVLQYTFKLIHVTQASKSPRFALVSKNISLSRAVSASFDSVEALSTLLQLLRSPRSLPSFESLVTLVNSSSDICK
jgi:hypothetical protein